MSKFKGVKKATPVAPVVNTPDTPVVASGTRTIVDIAKSLKIAPSAARRIARARRDELGGHAHGGRWFLNDTQASALIDMLTSTKEKAKHAAD